jgi:hypothetical protein
MDLTKADLLLRKPASAGACCDTFMFSGFVKGTVCYGVLGCDGKWFYSYLGERASSVFTLKLEVVGLSKVSVPFFTQRSGTS